MARPRETPEKADQWLSLRVTSDLIEHIDSRRGSRTRGRYVRDLIRADTAEATQETTIEVPEVKNEVTQGRHLHRRSTVVRVETIRGQQVKVWACECGQEMK